MGTQDTTAVVETTTKHDFGQTRDTCMYCDAPKGATTRCAKRPVSPWDKPIDIRALKDCVLRARKLTPLVDDLERACWHLRELGLSWSEISGEYADVVLRLQRDEEAAG